MLFSALVFRRVSKPFLSVVMPGWGLWLRVFWSMVCHISMSVLTS